jgi:hypothetical protein
MARYTHAMSRSTASLLLALLALVAASGGCATAPARTPPELVFITIDATPPDAYVYLDGQPLGAIREVASRAFYVTRGTHTVVIVAPGMRPFRQDLVMQDNSPQFVRTILLPR